MWESGKKWNCATVVFNSYITSLSKGKVNSRNGGEGRKCFADQVVTEIGVIGYRNCIQSSITGRPGHTRKPIFNGDCD